MCDFMDYIGSIIFGIFYTTSIIELYSCNFWGKKWREFFPVQNVNTKEHGKTIFKVTSNYFTEHFNAQNVITKQDGKVIFRCTSKLFIKVKHSHVHTVISKQKLKAIFRCTLNFVFLENHNVTRVSLHIKWHERNQKQFIKVIYFRVLTAITKHNRKAIFKYTSNQFTKVRPSKARFKVSLQTHIKSIHRGGTFQCPECDHKTKWKGSLQEHIQSIHK